MQDMSSDSDLDESSSMLLEFAAVKGQLASYQQLNSDLSKVS